MEELVHAALKLHQLDADASRVRLFDRVGRRVSDVGAVVAAQGDVYLVTGDEIFFYPGIRVGHVENVTVGGRSYPMRTVSMRPRVFVIEGLLTDAECDQVRSSLSLPFILPSCCSAMRTPLLVSKLK